MNRLFALAPHFGLAFLRLLVNRDIVPADYPTELANRQRARLATHDISLVVLPDQHQRARRRDGRCCRCRHRRLPDARRREDRRARGEARLPGVRGAGDRAPRVTPTRRLADSPTRRLRASLAEYIVLLLERTTYSYRIVRRTRISNSTPYSYLEYSYRRTRISILVFIVSLEFLDVLVFDFRTCTRILDLKHTTRNSPLDSSSNSLESLDRRSLDPFDPSCRLRASFRRGRVWQGTRTVPLPPSHEYTYEAFTSYVRRFLVIIFIFEVSKIRRIVDRRVHRVTYSFVCACVSSY